MSSNGPPPPWKTYHSAPPFTVVLTVVLLIFFFVAFFSIYLCKCFMDSVFSNWNLPRSASGNIINSDGQQTENRGLDPSLIRIFPTFSYSTVKDFQRAKYSFECAICLAEFKDDDLLRLLTVCYHLFHEDCIDLWLKSNKTCPVCRSDLDLPRETLEKNPILDMNDSHRSNELRIDVREEDKEIKSIIHESDANQKVERFPRSHSTGHESQIVKDRYNIILVENVKVKHSRRHNTSKSCMAFGEFSSPRVEVGCSNANINRV
ncbi:RING-H2 finger protein ATL29-like [Mercurialis annua]|uniref:RING-H2 finger protein ATL29-like n=1 Tax=Mercurialis annua TaxID=3986 RepID=UPI00215F7D36|nr:RING-H2 finger protein ATL29-like [Mercurialis annua]